MDATTLINEHLDVVKLLEHYDFDSIRQDDNMVRACCKIHNGNNKTAFVINIETGLWYCFTGGCGGGDVYTLVQKLENVDFKSAVKKVADIFGIDINTLKIKERKPGYLKQINDFVKMMKRGKKKELKSFHIKEKIREVVKYKDFKEDTIKHFQLGFVESVNLYKKDGDAYTLYNRLVFPIIFNGIQVAISFRRIKSKDIPKWSHQPVDLNIGDYLYNYDNVKGESNIVITEGITDVWAFHEVELPAVCVFGSSISNEQYKLLLKTGANLILAFDGDKAGKKATENAIKMFKNKSNLYIISFDEGQDPENISREELIELYGRKQRV